MQNRYQNWGFTLIELLVVIAIIGVLASVTLASLADARLEARNAVAKQDIRGVVSGIQMLITDTGKAPNGCPFNSIRNPEVFLDTARGGLLQRPNVEVIGWGCEWTADEVARWDGPYIESVIDPWGEPYQYDPDYYPNSNCPSIPSGSVIQAVVSRGPDQAWYTCDDVYLELR